MQQSLVYNIVGFLPPKWPSRGHGGAWLHDGAASDSEVCKFQNQLDLEQRFVNLLEAGRESVDRSGGLPWKEAHSGGRLSNRGSVSKHPLIPDFV